jgi:Cdc6-like AAA superfamily ATPase
MLAKNIVVVAACNPARAQIQTTTRERDLGKSWASGHYQVAKLPVSMTKLKWSFGSLTHSQEKEFIYRRIEALQSSVMPPYLRVSLTEVVSEAHKMMRTFAERNILADIRRNREEDYVDVEADANERARSIVSLRDIQRVFAMFSFFLDDMSKDFNRERRSEAERFRHAMLLSVSTVYYLRLDGLSRVEFLSTLEALPTEAGRRPGLLEVLNHAMDSVIASTEIPPGIAITRGLKENVFVTMVCVFSQTPLIIVGPPGSSKTLAVHVVGDNANGSDSVNPFYSKRPRLSLFHYQCSKQSTSKEISAVFDQAIQRQERIDSSKHRCVVFMDEAGLPEEEKESLKVLHYLLESHMSAKAKVGFVAISNHVLDAAKSNRCIMLLRQDPDEEEMLSIAVGVLFDLREDRRACAHDVEIDHVLVPARDFASGLCMSYRSLFHNGSPLTHLNTFFGLRDFIYFLKALRVVSTVELTRMFTSVKFIIYAIERNFNGVSADDLRQVTA